MPKYYPEKKVLYRSLTCQVNLSGGNEDKNTVAYTYGNKKTFWGFTSTSTDPNVAYSFLKDTVNEVNEKVAMKTWTVFALSGDVWGYDIELFNYYHEKEILLEPERKFIVTEILHLLMALLI